MAMTNIEEGITSISTENSRQSNLFLSRQLNGTSFLTLEHVGYFALVVLLPIMLLMGTVTAMSLWSGNGRGGMVVPLANIIGSPLQLLDTSKAVAIAASLLVLTPLLYILRRRTAAEYVKRPGYTNRVAYKLPIYTALAVLVALTIGSFVNMLSVFLNSLVQIGVSGVNMGKLYTGDFLPALLAFVVFGMAGWYVLWFAKGKDTSKVFVSIIGLLASVAVITLLVTALTINHQSKVQPIQPQPFPLQDSGGP